MRLSGCNDEIPYPRKGTPDDIANTAFLVAPEGEYITGQTICVTGGIGCDDKIEVAKVLLE